jgi:Tfp pilus assembly protein PilO
MQLKIFLILFCIIAVLFVGFNEGTTTKSTTTKNTTTESTTMKSTTTKKATPISKQKIPTQTK